MVSETEKVGPRTMAGQIGPRTRMLRERVLSATREKSCVEGAEKSRAVRTHTWGP